LSLITWIEYDKRWAETDKYARSLCQSGSGSGSLVGRAPELRHHTNGVHDYGAA